MKQFKLWVESCFALLSNQWMHFFAKYRAQPFLIEQELATIQQCNDHTNKRLIEPLHR